MTTDAEFAEALEAAAKKHDEEKGLTEWTQSHADETDPRMVTAVTDALKMLQDTQSVSARTRIDTLAQKLGVTPIREEAVPTPSIITLALSEFGAQIIRFLVTHAEPEDVALCLEDEGIEDADVDRITSLLAAVEDELKGQGLR